MRTSTKPRKLGDTQKCVLESLVSHGYWSTYRCGWVWDGQARTLRFMRALHERGLARVTVREGHPHFVPTPEGKRLAEVIRAERYAKNETEATCDKRFR